MDSAAQRLEPFDNPWRRLGWTTLAGILAWVLILGAFLWLIQAPVVRPETPLAIDAELIEEPPPRVTPPVPKPVPVPETLKPTPVHQMPALAQRADVPVPPTVQTPVDTTQAVAKPMEAAPSPIPLPPPVAPPANAAPAAPVKESAIGGVSSGAHAIYRPMPAIPDDLRDEAFTAAALARFEVATDGSVTVALVKPTQNPRINRLLLESLKTWHFFPELKDGKPVSSSQDVVVRFEVK